MTTTTGSSVSTATATASSPTTASRSSSFSSLVVDPRLRVIGRDVFSATIGSLCCCYSGQPLDIIKVKMQTNPKRYTTTIGTGTAIWRQQGLTAFWKGSVPTAMGMMNENVVAFGIHEALKRAFPDSKEKEKNGKPNLLKPFLLGPITGCSAALVLGPAEIVKAKTQMATTKSACPKTIAKQMIQQQGIKSMFVGMDGQLMRDGMFYTIFFGGYEVCKHYLGVAWPQMPDEIKYYISGGIAGMAGWTVAIPFDGPKTVIQSKWNTRVFGDYFPELRRVAASSGGGLGFNGLYRGIGPALVRAFVANSALFLGVETAKRYFDTVFV